MLPWFMSARIIPFLSPPPLSQPQPAHAHFVTFRKTASPCFQQLAHSSQFTMRYIHLIFSSLRTLYQKHPGRSPVASKIAALNLTPIESKRYANIILICFRMKTIHDTPGVGGTRV